MGERGKRQSEAEDGALSGIEREMAKSYVLVHSRLINKHVRSADRGDAAWARIELQHAANEARSVAATLERLILRAG